MPLRQTAGTEAKPEIARDRGVTARSVLLGLGVVVLINLWMPYSEYIIFASRMNLSHFPVASFILFILIVLLLNPLIKSLSPGAALSSSELLVVVALGLVGGVVPGSGVMGFLFGAIASPYYFANPENRWAEYFHDHLPDWLVPADRGGAMRDFFEGAPLGRPVPWDVWIIPLIWWLSFVLVILFVTTCIAVILRRQWSDRERLTFPLMSPALDMVDEAGAPGPRPAFARSGLFWVGFCITFGISAWNILPWFWPLIPEIQLTYPYFYFARAFPPFFPRFNIYVMGFAYFANLDVLFSMWFFHLIFYQIQGGIMNRFGYTMDSRGDPYGSLVFSGAGWQSFGALCFFVFWGLWVGRRHLKDVFLKAFRTAHPVDDRGEMVSYRTAVFGTLIGTVYIAFWLARSGMEPKAVLFYLIGTFVIYVGVARIVAQTGILFVQAPISAQVFTIYTLGAHSLSAATMTSMALSYALTNYIRGLFMPALVHIARLSEFVQANRRRLFWAVFLGVIVGSLVFIGYVIPLGYEHGAYNFRDIPLRSGINRIYPVVMSKMVNPFDTDWTRLGFFGGGAVLMALLTFLQHRFTRWPLHPIGLTVCSTNVARSNQISIFLIWAFKTLVLRVGGVTAYRRLRPLFVGLLVGYGLGVALSFVVDAIWFPGQGHYVHRW